MLSFGRDVTIDFDQATAKEWLITNGIGGFASGTISGAPTRHYHGLLVAALNPPLGRTVLLTKIDEFIRYDNRNFALHASNWRGNEVDAAGLRYLSSFALDGTTPVWTYEFADAALEKRVVMQHGANTTYITYTLRRATQPLELRAKTLVNYRNFHGGVEAGAWQMQIDAIENGLRVNAFDGAVPFYLLSDSAKLEPRHEWYHDYHHRVEAYRGLGVNSDNLYAGEMSISLNAGDSVTLVATTNPKARLGGEAAFAEQLHYENRLIEQSQLPKNAPDPIKHLVLAADQFIVQRQVEDNPDGRSIIAGYHWFGDWGRDTMIALPGLTLTTKRHDVAETILRTFAKYVDQGMIPNRFPDEGDVPEYNTVDATLWYIHAIRETYEATQNEQLLKDLFPILQSIIDWHQKGTRYNIKVDGKDGLLYSGEKGVQLTWMDAKVDGWVVTPRIGKAIEINGLWYNALKNMAYFAEKIGESGGTYAAAATQVEQSFGRFWNADKNYCYDVLDTPDGDDDSLRPNQLFAVSLRYSPLTEAQQKAVVDTCARRLLTPHGMRSLDSDHPDYVQIYGGDTFQRDSSYHQGTVWSWLIGSFVEAYLRVYGDRQQAETILLSLMMHLDQACIGSISEIFDAEPPFTPRGAVAQAWGVAEVLRAWQLTQNP